MNDAKLPDGTTDRAREIAEQLRALLDERMARATGEDAVVERYAQQSALMMLLRKSVATTKDVDLILISQLAGELARTE